MQKASSYVDRALRQNPRLQALRKKMAGARKAVDLAGLSRWPDVTLGVDYFQTGSALAPGTSGSGDDPVSVSVMFSLPIWPGKYAAEQREARSRLHAASHEHADLQIPLRADVELVAYELADAGRQIRLYSKSLLPRAREALTLTRTAYRTGKRSLLDVIVSEQALLAFETSYWRACRDYVQGQARMKAIVGGEIK